MDEEQHIDDEYQNESANNEPFLRRMQDIYSKFQDDSGNISVQNLLKILQALGYNPSSTDCQQRIEDFSVEGRNVLSFEDVLMVCQEPWTNVNNRDALLAALKTFDSEGNGYIDADKFRKLMTTLGEPLSDNEIDDLINLSNNDGKISFEELTDTLFGDVFADDSDYNNEFYTGDNVNGNESIDDENKENI
ncbi:unnamed protein product [Didymodactylos carnosus]|uniref:EF-hand domain-containing protein n=1 Tax=Didymodactylos carnosus TaxID=1234261 RepID=A0A814BBE9_9BILA|nr:unnamed protein product [Didymodactylos carnosus]CAF0923688.1 unnamed protein product [Didymodactylos carnosus]CAF3599105.1 unnamed protein product [Didymodactylos carnosus]CAF3702662.1 unnamed protein product [Didymodactylos carnosus]